MVHEAEKPLVTAEPETGSPAVNSTSYPKYVVNLDLPPRERWNHVAKDYKESAHILQLAYEKALQAEFGVFGEFALAEYSDG